ncbi:MAG: AAA family ATPase [Desulfurococcales archaeon]|nr:AAA family ATPase [Desulfurococcales archaeon]
MRARIIVDPEVFQDTYTPNPLPVRHEIVQELVSKYLLALERGHPSTDITLIYGKYPGVVGIGKTTIARLTGRLLEETAKRRGYNVKFLHINTYGYRGVHDLVNAILESLGAAVAKRGISLADKISHLADILYMKNLRLFLVLDEVQNLFLRGRDEAENLYMLLRIHEIKPSRIRGTVGADYLLIAQDSKILSLIRAMLPQVESQIGWRIPVEPYTTRELFEILLDRARRGLAPGSWDDEILERIACYYGRDCPEAGDPRGIARKAIIALRTAAEKAEARGASRITDLDVSHALSEEAEALVDVSMLEALDKHRLILLLAIAELTLEKGDYASTGEIREKYEELASLYGEKPRKHSQLHEYIRDLRYKGLIIARPSGKGVRGRTTLIRLAQEIPPDVARMIIRSILEGRMRF